jgi:hypothetical protein
MSKNKKVTRSLATQDEMDEFAVGTLVTDMAKPKKQLPLTADEIFGADAAKALDAFENQLGLKQGAKLKAPNLLYKNILLSPGFDEEDRTTLNQLLNDRELYSIIRVTDSWTARGDYKIFVIFAENQDEKARRAALTKQKEQA